MSSDTARGAVYMTLAMAAFTLNDTCMKAVTADLPLYQTITLRGLVTLIALALIAQRRGGLHLGMARGDARLLGWRTLGEVAATLTFLTALRHMPLANLSAIMQSLPLAVTLTAALVLAEPVGWRRMAAIGTGFVGVLMIVRPGTEGFDTWSLVALASVGFVILRDLSTRRLSSEVPSVTVAFLAAASVTLTGAALSPLEGWVAVRPVSAALILAAGGFLIVGYLSVVMAMRVGDIATVAPFRYTALIFAVGLGWLAFGHLPGPMTLAGASIIVASGIYTFYRERLRGRIVATPVKAPLRLR
ncbi:Riboflavin transporter [Defluviimonas aquaemixtae]|uniref:Riboflavin transporter n=1 Tax=Albidovulum aquaemixtae TaxID=1542388 RepID=A0A2R8BP11_9RHOB|nr:DMT family transporter [Defluviimonas aquaemixtae]SPH25097.1 Riboflavin transporter [Defluviimonas aquaemixtae]